MEFKDILFGECGQVMCLLHYCFFDIWFKVLDLLAQKTYMFHVNNLKEKKQSMTIKEVREIERIGSFCKIMHEKEGDPLG